MNEVKISKKVSYLLRHNPEDLNLDGNGWCNVQDLLNKVKISMGQLESVVKNNDKQRFSFNEDKTKIRANQGHSIQVDVQLKKKIPPPVLYHGTTPRIKKDIMKKGLLKMNRNHVHLSGDKDTAIKVGKRHCRNNEDPCILEILTTNMIKDNVEFYLSENNVWLVDTVDPKYLKVV